mgnify:CR=1 FL=1
MDGAAVDRQVAVQAVEAKQGHDNAVAAGQHLSAPRASDLSLPKGFGSRHWAAAEISRATSAIAITTP